MSSAEGQTSREPVAERGPEEVRAAVEEISWYHTLELAPGLVTEGMFDHAPYVERYGLPADLTGQRVLDVGTFDGYWAFECERRGGDVTALDVDRTQQLDWPPRLRPKDDEERGSSFRLAAEMLDSSVDRVGRSIYDATPENMGGTFDLVVCSSILIHLRDPMLALERMAALCRGRLVLVEEYSKRLNLVPFVKAAEFRGETPWSVWWRPNIRGWLAITRCAGFEDVEHKGHFNMRFRTLRGGVPHVVIHGRGPAD